MCWGAKVKTPAVSMPNTAPAPAPVSEAPQGVAFGDDDNSKPSETGINSVKVDLATDKNTTESSTNFGAPIPTGSQSTGLKIQGVSKALAGAIRK